MAWPAIAMIAGAGISAAGDIWKQIDAAKQQKRVNRYAEQQLGDLYGPSQWERGIAGMLRGRKDATMFDPAAWDIDMGGINQTINAGNDGLMQFLRANPLAQMQAAYGGQFDTSQSFRDLQASDDMMINRQASALRGGFSGLGQRFGSSARGAEGRLRSDFSAQIGARNAGIRQNAFESAAGRQLAATQSGLGLQLQGYTTQAQQGMQAAQLAAAIAQANQGSHRDIANYNLMASNQNWLQQLQGQQTGYNMLMGRRGAKANLLSIMAGIPQASGNVLTAAGGGIGDIGAIAALAPYLQKQGS